MSLATSNRDGGRTNEAGHLRGVTKGFMGQVLSGLAVSQRGAGANMSVDVAIGDAIIQRSDGTYGHPAWNDAVYNRTVAAADGSNPRRDIIVMYIDYAETPSTGVANNTNGVVKIISVAGTAAGSPVDPSNATIQSAVGSGNPWIKLARVRLAAGATSVSNSVIDDLREMSSAQNNGGWDSVPNIETPLAFSSFSSSTRVGVITAPTDATTRYTPGNKIKFYQATGGWKYGFIVAVTATTITVFFGPSFTLNNEAIMIPAYSCDHIPRGYTGPQLIKESYRSHTTNSERWVYEQTGWTWVVGTGTALVSFAVALPVTYAQPPLINCNQMAARATASGTPTSPADFVTPFSSATACYPDDITTSGFNMTAHSSGANFSNTFNFGFSWHARGVVA